MADASRFPRLELPFAIIGASAGWLSTGLVSNPLLLGGSRIAQIVATPMAALFAVVVAAIVRRLCVGKRYYYELEEPDPEARPRSDRAFGHVAVILFAGAATGALVTVTCEQWGGAAAGALGGLMCTLAFVPVCFAVLAAARRAQRARLGSIVAASDRRAVWGILATTLGVMTLEALPDWPAASARLAPLPIPAFCAAAIAAVVVYATLVLDARAHRSAREAIVDLAASAAQDDDSSLVRVDLGLGNELGAKVTRSASPYRGRDMALGLVRGNPELALRAMHRSVARGVASLVLVATVIVLHGVANTGPASHAYASKIARRCASCDAFVTYAR